MEEVKPVLTGNFEFEIENKSLTFAQFGILVLSGI